MKQSLKVSGFMFLLLLASLIFLFLPPIKLPVFNSQLTLYIGELLLLLLVILTGVSLLKNGYLQINNLTKLFFSFLVISFLSITNATDIGRFMIGFVAYVETFLILLVFTNLKFSEKQSYKAIKIYLYSSIVLVLFIIQETIFTNKGNFIIGQKIDIAIGGSNYLASLLLIPLFIFYTILIKEKFTLRNTGYLLCFIAVSISIIYTGSRTSLFIVGALLILYPIQDVIFSKQRFGRKIISITLMLVIAILLYYFGGNFINGMITQGRFENLSEQSNLTSRFVIFNEYFKAFLEHPIVGNGYNNVDALNRYFLAHNYILQILGDAGVLACVVFIIFIFSTFAFLNKKINTVSNPLLNFFIIGYKRGFSAVLLHGLLEPNFGTKLFMLYVFLGLGIIISSTKIVDLKK